MKNDHSIGCWFNWLIVLIQLWLKMSSAFCFIFCSHLILNDHGSLEYKIWLSEHFLKGREMICNSVSELEHFISLQRKKDMQFHSSYSQTGYHFNCVYKDSFRLTERVKHAKFENHDKHCYCKWKMSFRWRHIRIPNGSQLQLKSQFNVIQYCVY